MRAEGAHRFNLVRKVVHKVVHEALTYTPWNYLVRAIGASTLRYDAASLPDLMSAHV